MTSVNKASQFWIQGTTDFGKGKDPRWSNTHPYYADYMEGYEFARREKKRKDKEWRRRNSLWTRFKAKVKAWIGK